MASMTSMTFGDDNNGFQIGNNHGSIHAEFHPPGKAQEPDNVSRY